MTLRGYSTPPLIMVSTGCFGRFETTLVDLERIGSDERLTLLVGILGNPASRFREMACLGCWGTK